MCSIEIEGFPVLQEKMFTGWFEFGDLIDTVLN